MRRDLTMKREMFW